METTLVAEDIFGKEAVKRLTDSDFLLNSTIPIGLRWNDCIVILFYDDSIESQNLIQIWAYTARHVIGPIMAAVHLPTQQKIAQAFVKMLETPGPYRTFGLKGYPFILAYQKGYPVGFFNGERSAQAIADWSLTLACKSDYSEGQQIAASTHISPDFEMSGLNEAPRRIDSLQYKAGQPIRQYDPSLGIKEVGSAAAAEATRREEAERAAEGVVEEAPPETGETGAGVEPGAETLGAGATPVAVQPATVASPTPGTTIAVQPGAV